MIVDFFEICEYIYVINEVLSQRLFPGLIQICCVLIGLELQNRFIFEAPIERYVTTAAVARTLDTFLLKTIKISWVFLNGLCVHYVHNIDRHELSVTKA